MGNITIRFEYKFFIVGTLKYVLRINSTYLEIYKKLVKRVMYSVLVLKRPIIKTRTV